VTLPRRTNLPSRLRRATLPWSFTEYSDVAEDGNLAAEGEFYMQVNFASGVNILKW
jgi:hypothetical protein